MSFKFKFIAAVAASALVALAAGTSNAAVILSNPSAIAGSGWSVSFSTPGIMLVDDGITSVNGVETVNLEKFAAFQSTEGLDITFTQTSATAAPFIDIQDESLTNVSGTAFTDFQFLIVNTLQGSSGPAKYVGPTDIFAPGAGNPFTTDAMTPDQESLTYAGGTLPNGGVAKFGFGDAGDLVIQANPNSSGPFKVIDFKEIPSTGTTHIPTPAALVPGMIGLALVVSARKLKATIA